MYRTVTLFCMLMFYLMAVPIKSLARMDLSLGDRRSLLIEGTFWNQSLIRSDDFKFSRQFDPVSNRSTAQFEITIENLLSKWWFIDKVDLFAIVRPTYEAIYDLRNNEFGDEGPAYRLTFEHGPEGPGFPLFNGVFFDSQGRPFVLQPPGPVAIHGPQRPNGTHPLFDLFALNPLAHGRVKLRGAENGLTNFEATENDIKWDRTDSNRTWPIREIYLDITAGKHWLRLGRQQVVWGKTDFFRAQDIPNPLDIGWHAFFEPWEDIRIPQWMVRYQYQLGKIGPLSNMALELVWNFDRFQPTSLGQRGSPWAHPFADALAWFALYNSAAGMITPDGRYWPFALWREAHPSWSLSNSEWGVRLEWLYKGWRFALTNWYGWQDDPIFVQDFAYTPDNPHPLLVSIFGPELSGWGGTLAVNYVRNNTTGLSVDYFIEPLSTVLRLESSFTNKAVVAAGGPDEYTDLNGYSSLHAETRVLKWSIGLDRPTWIPWLNATKSTFLSFQSIFTHYLDHKGGRHDGFAVPDTEPVFTFVAQTLYYRDRVIPLAFVGYLPTGRAWMGGFNCEWLITDNWSAKAGVNIISGAKQRFHIGSNTFWPLLAGAEAVPYAFGQVPPEAFARLGRPHAEVLGLARENFGAYRDRDEFFFKFQYRF